MLNILLSPQLFFLILIILILLFYRKKLYFLINIQDKPDGSLKIHKSKTHSIGGIIFYINIIIFFLKDYLFNNNSIFFNKEHLLETLVLLFSLSFMFLIGLYDDKYFLSYKIKFLLLLLVIIPCLIVDKNLKIGRAHV